MAQANSVRPRQPALDGLRGLAALIVFFSHVSDATGAFWWFGQGAGYIGVMLFFCLSGYLLTYLYLDTQTSFNNLGRYIARRTGRILPLYYVAVTFALILQAGGLVLFISPVESAVQHYLCLRGVGVFWTIPIELQFYLVFLVLWIIAARIPATKYAAPIIVVALACLFPLDPLRSWNTLPLYLGYFAVGMLIARVPDFRAPQWFWSIAFASFALAFFLRMPTPAAFLMSTPPDPPLQIWGAPLCLLILGGLLLSSVRSDVARILLGSRVAAGVGAISYSIYLVHLPVVTLIAEYTALKDSPLPFMALAFVITIALSTLSYRYVERPGQALAAVLERYLSIRLRNEPAADR